MENRLPASSPAARPRIPFMDRPTCSIAEACDAAGIGKTKLYDLIDSGAVDSVRLGRRRLIRVPSLLKLLGAPPPPSFVKK